MSSQEAPRARRFPMEAGDCRGAATALETRQRVGTARSAGRQLRRCPANHRLTLPYVPVDVFIAMGGNCRLRSL